MRDERKPKRVPDFIFLASWSDGGVGNRNGGEGGFIVKIMKSLGIITARLEPFGCEEVGKGRAWLFWTHQHINDCPEPWK